MKILHCNWKWYWWRNDHVNRSGIEGRSRTRKVKWLRRRLENWAITAVENCRVPTRCD